MPKPREYFRDYPYAVRLMQRRFALTVALSLIAVSMVCNIAHATDYTVTDSTSFYNAIQSIDNAPTSSDRIIISNSFTMSQQVLAITTTGSLTIVGNNNTINGNGAYRPFFIESGNVTLQNLTITDAQAHGGNGGNGGGGGGLGAGAAIFVDTNGNVSIQNVNFTSNAAIGGSGGNYTGADGGGGGLGGNAGVNQGGGGGLYGAGGTASNENSGGGGGGELGNGGSNIGSTYSSGGGGGGAGTTAAGGNTSTTTGGTAGGAQGGAGGSGSNGNGQDAVAAGGGGGGGASISGNGGNGALFGGGGSAGVTGSSGGNGGDFGGGGGAGQNGGDHGGNGGFGGGGGSAYSGTGGNGGFGAGAGGGATGGTAGFGGGSSGSRFGTPTGGGGAAFGGAIFVRQGGSISIVDSTSFSGNTVSAGGSSGTGAAGSTDGNDIFLMRGTTTSFNISSGQTMTFSPVLGNNDGTVQPGAAIDKIGAGTLVLTGNSTLSGTTYVEAGTLQINGSVGPFITVSASATLSGTSTTLNQTITSSGHVLLTENGTSSYNINNVHGAGDFTKDGAGTLSLSGTAFYTGGTNVAAGTLVGDTTSLKRTFTDSGNITFNQSSDGTFAGSITGTGSVSILGGHNVFFTGTNSYSGGTNVAGGTLAGDTTNLQGTFTDSGNITFNQSTDGTFTGSITGTGSVTIAGTGNVFFSGTNSYSGGTIISSGTLTILSSGNYSGIVGSGGLDFSAPGTSTLSGNNTYFGATTVNAGTLVVNSTLAGPMTVNSGGTLMGVGTVGDTTISTGGTIYPGIVGAPLTINGSFTQSTGTTYSAEVSPTDSDKIIVNGHATIQSGTTFNIVLDPGTYTAGTHYVVLTASGGISGTYTNTIMPSPGTGLFFSLIYDPNDIQLIINDPPSASFASFAQTFNQWQVGTALDTISPSATGGMSTLVMQLEGLSSNQIPGALNQLAGDIYPSIASIELQTTTTWLQLISNRLGAKVRVYEPSQGFVVNEKGTSNDPDAEVYLVSYQPSNSAYGAPMRMSFRQATRPLWSAWTQGYGLGGNVASNGNAGALNYGLGGTTFGIDRWLGERTLVGVLGGYAGSSANNVLVPGRSSINGYQVGLYGMHCRDYVYLSNIDAYSNDTYDATRQISIGTINGTAKSNTFSNQWAHYSELGATFTGASVRLQPFGGIQYIYLDQNAFGETGVTPANLNVSQQITNSVRGSAGARLSWLGSIGNVRVIPVVHGRYQREWGDGTRLVTSSFTGAPTVAFNTTGNTLGRDFGLFGLGLTAMITPRTSLYGGYDLQVASRYAANMGSAGFQFRW